MHRGAATDSLHQFLNIHAKDVTRRHAEKMLKRWIKKTDSRVRLDATDDQHRFTDAIDELREQIFGRYLHNGWTGAFDISQTLAVAAP